MMMEWLTDLFGRLIEAVKGGLRAFVESFLPRLDEAATAMEKLDEAVADAIASAIRRAKNRAAQDAPPRLAVAAATPGKRTYSPAAMRRHTAVTGD